MKKSNYWAKREADELKWQKEQEKDLQAYNKHIAELFQKAIDNINDDIKKDIGYAGGSLIKADSMREYERLAKDAVEKAQQMMKAGKHVTRKDFSKDVNDRLKIYNATMRINRNEILKSKIGAHLVELGIEQESSLTNKLWNAYIKEKDRQAGILRVTTKGSVWTSKEVQEQIYKQIANADFSKRVWADIDGLKGQLDGLVSTAIIRGDNPKEMAKWLTGMVSASINNQKYAAERLARTETTRVQFLAQKMTIKQGGYKYVKWFAEGSACKACKEIAGEDSGYGDGIYLYNEVPDIPVHPNCMCSISAYWVEDDKKNENQELADDQDVETIRRDLRASGFETAYGENLAKELAQTINRLDVSQKQMYLNHLNELKFSVPSSGGSYVKGNVIYIPKKDLLETSTENKFGIFFHETGHALDVPAKLSKGKTPTLDDIKNPSQKVGLGEAMLNDFKTWVYGNLPEMSSLGKSPRRNSKAYPEWNKKYMDLFGARTEAEYKFDEVIDKLKKLPPRTRSNLSDMIESADSRLGDYKWATNPLGMGHTQNDYNYWKDQDIGNAESEFFAEVNSALATNPESLKLIKKYFPTSYKKYFEIVKIINNK